MTYTELEEAVEICYYANITPFIWGHTGVGKSSKVQQFALNRKMGFIDLRLSQCEASDVRGMPDKDMEKRRTVFFPPEELPEGDLTWDQFEEKIKAVPEHEQKALRHTMQNRLKTGILFLDELPRAPEDVLQAIFQLVLDRKIGKYVLPEGWGIVCAGNFLEGYQQTGFSDPAFIARFCHLTLSTGSTTLEEWIDYMTQQHGELASPIIEFASSNIDHLDGIRAGQLGFDIQPCRRSWESVAKIVEVCNIRKKYNPTTILAVNTGLVGMAMATAFGNFNLKVKPREIVERGVRHYHDLLVETAKERGKLIGLMWGLLATLRPRVDEEKMATIALDFAEWMCDNVDENDLTVAFCRCMAGSGGGSDGDHIRAAAMSNSRVAVLLKRVRQNAPDVKKRFIERLCDRPKLQSILAQISWGKDIDEDHPVDLEE